MKALASKPVTYNVADDGAFFDTQDVNDLQIFFTRLFASANRAEIADSVVLKMKSQQLNQTSFTEVQGAYSRTILAKAKNGFEAMIARWSLNTTTAVHGHPDYALYLLIEGRLGVENFVLEHDGGLKSVGAHEMGPGDYFVKEGRSFTYSNAIHRITVLEESLSLHIYSDDALKGRCFSDYPLASPFLNKVVVGGPTVSAT